MKKTITMMLCITSILLISACSQVEQNQSDNIRTDKQIQKQTTDLDIQIKDLEMEDELLNSKKTPKEKTTSNSTSKIDNSQNNDLNINSTFPKPPSQKQLSMFESEYYVSSDAECSSSCLKELLFFEDENYATDGKNIYVNVFDGGSSWSANYQIMDNIDINSFQLLNYSKGYTHYFKDKNHVYFNTYSTYENLDTNIKVLKNIDPQTVRVISTHCIADKNAVYCDIPYVYPDKEVEMKKVEGADPDSFEMEKKSNYETIFYDKSNRFKNVADKGIDIQMVE